MKKKVEKKMTIKEFAQGYALSEFLTSIPEDKTFDEIVADIRNHDDINITITERYEIDDAEDVADMIVDMATDLEAAFMRVHNGEFVVGEESEKGTVKFFSLEAKDHSNAHMTIYLRYIGWNDSVNDDDIIARMEDSGVDFSEIKTFYSPESITEETFNNIATGNTGNVFVDRED